MSKNPKIIRIKDKCYIFTAIYPDIYGDILICWGICSKIMIDTLAFKGTENV